MNLNYFMIFNFRNNTLEYNLLVTQKVVSVNTLLFLEFKNDF